MSVQWLDGYCMSAEFQLDVGGAFSTVNAVRMCVCIASCTLRMLLVCALCIRWWSVSVFERICMNHSNSQTFLQQ